MSMRLVGFSAACKDGNALRMLGFAHFDHHRGRILPPLPNSVPVTLEPVSRYKAFLCAWFCPGIVITST